MTDLQFFRGLFITLAVVSVFLFLGFLVSQGTCPDGMVYVKTDNLSGCVPVETAMEVME